MKLNLKSSFLPMIALVGGLLTMLMRLWLVALGRDERDLLAAGNFPDVVSWILTGLVMIVLVLGTWNLTEAAKYSFNFPTSESAAIGIAMGAIGILITSLSELFASPDTLTVYSCILGLVATPALLFIAYCRKTGKRPSILFHGVVCLYLMLHLISHYRLWSAIPQLQSYAFELLAIVFVMLACYQRAAFDVGRGDRRCYALFTLAALFFCIAALPGCDNAAFFLGCAVWMAATPCNLKPLPTQFGKQDA